MANVPGRLKEIRSVVEMRSTFIPKALNQISEVSRPRIQNVPEYMASRVEFKKFYEPQLIAIGLLPYFSESRNIHLGEPDKSKWTAMYLHCTNQTMEDLYEKISMADDRRELLFQHSDFGGELMNYYGDQLFRTLLWDGCSILQLLEKSNNSVDSELELKISINKLVQVHQDLLILNNQIPFKMLKLLCIDDPSRLKKCLQNFLEIHGVKPVEIEDDPNHLLDYLRKALLKRDIVQVNIESKNNGKNLQRRNLHLTKYRIGTIRELKAAGIRVRKDPNNNTFYPSFSNGTLYLPELIVDGSTAHIFLNLMAYEMCPDFRNDLEITSYVVFMSSLIDQAEDVKELRSVGILINQLANDKEVAALFNKMDSVLVPETLRFAEIRDQIHNHLESKRYRIKILGWMGEAYETYFRSPWAIIALLAGSLGLILTFIQTWFAIHPKGL